MSILRGRVIRSGRKREPGTLFAHRRRPRLRQCFHPPVQSEACGRDRTLGVNRATAIFHAAADGPLVHIQCDVIHRCWGASLVFLNQQPLSSALYTKRSSFGLYIESNQACRRCNFCRMINSKSTRAGRRMSDSDAARCASPRWKCRSRDPIGLPGWSVPRQIVLRAASW